MGVVWGVGCGFVADFLVVVRGGCCGMIIFLCFVIGVEIGGEVIELVEF